MFVQPPMAFQQPDVFLTEGVATAAKPEGGVVRLTVDGKDWHVSTAAFNAAILGAPASESGKYRCKLTSQKIEFVPVSDPSGKVAAKDGPKAQGCANPSCKCNPCECGPDCKCVGHTAKLEAIQHTDDPLSGIPNFGVDVAKIRSAAQRYEYSINGKPCTKRQAVEAMEGKGAGAINDDSAHTRLSCIGTEEQCKQIESDVASNPAFKDLPFTFQSYRPSDPMVRDIGVAPGSPSIYLQQPDGKVLARWENYPGADAVAGELRKRKPDYDPSKDPQPSKPNPLNPLKGFDWSSLPVWVYILGGLFLARFLQAPPKT
jgi:hypothetical protein